MKRVIIAVAFVAAVATQAPATGIQTTYKGSHVTVQAVDVKAIKERVRERVRARWRSWFDEKLAALTAPVPEPVTEPMPSYSGGVLSAEQVASYARGAGFPESVIPTMVSIAARESGFDPGAINASSGACGLWQIYPAQPGCTDPATNAAMAFAKYQASGLAPWGG